MGERKSILNDKFISKKELWDNRGDMRYKVLSVSTGLGEHFIYNCRHNC